jgi:hypothetical protein
LGTSDFIIAIRDKYIPFVIFEGSPEFGFFGVLEDEPMGIGTVGVDSVGAVFSF